MNHEPDKRKPATMLATEAIIGLIVAAILLWSLVAAGGDIRFVYQGL
jgi:hypothetical protein